MNKYSVKREFVLVVSCEIKAETLEDAAVLARYYYANVECSLTKQGVLCTIERCGEKLLSVSEASPSVVKEKQPFTLCVSFTPGLYPYYLKGPLGHAGISGSSGEWRRVALVLADWNDLSPPLTFERLGLFNNSIGEPVLSSGRANQHKETFELSNIKEFSKHILSVIGE